MSHAKLTTLDREVSRASGRRLEPGYDVRGKMSRESSSVFHLGRVFFHQITDSRQLWWVISSRSSCPRLLFPCPLALVDLLERPSLGSTSPPGASLALTFHRWGHRVRTLIKFDRYVVLDD
eukprot:m.281887 g.281887  ORF g.281887 m.281887 type:complete len:121 (+) comp16181_c0_seq1:1772-2134(+)